MIGAAAYCPLAICTMFSLLLHPVCSGSAEHQRLPRDRGRYMPRGMFPAKARDLLTWHHERHPHETPVDRLVWVRMDLPQPKRQLITPTGYFDSRLFDAPMTVTIRSSHQNKDSDWGIDDIRETIAVYLNDKVKKGPFDHPTNLIDPSSEPFRRLGWARDHLNLADVSQFDILDAMQAIRHNWGRRILLPQGKISHISAIFMRFSQGVFLRALRGKVCIILSMNEQLIFIALDGGPEHVYTVPYSLMHTPLGALFKEPPEYRKGNPRSEIERPPEWLRRAEASPS